MAKPCAITFASSWAAKHGRSVRDPFRRFELVLHAGLASQLALIAVAEFSVTADVGRPRFRSVERFARGDN